MKLFFIRYRIQIGLLLISLTLFIGFIQFFALQINILNYKDLLVLLTSIGTFLVLSFGTLFTYYKFFKEHIFSEKITLTLTVNVYQKNSSNNIVFLNATIKNIGNVAIFDTKSTILGLLVTEYDSKEVAYSFESMEVSDENYDSIILPQAVVNLHSMHEVPEEVIFVKYTFIITSKRKNIWNRIISIRNKDGFVYKE